MHVYIHVRRHDGHRVDSQTFQLIDTSTHRHFNP